MTSSATRRKLRREQERAKLAAARTSPLADPVFGIDVDRWRGHGQYALRVRWLVERDPFYGLLGLTRLREHTLPALEINLVTDARGQGYSWADIGFALDVTGEAARKRFAERVEQLLADDGAG